VDAETGYPNLAKWAKIFTTGIVFDPLRVRQCAKKLASDASERKRDGCIVATTALNSMVNQQNTNAYMCDELVLEKFHENVAKICETHPEEVVKKLEEVRSALFSRGVNAHFLCNVDLIDDKLFNHYQWDFVETGFGKAEKFMGKAGESVDMDFVGRQKVLGVGGSESSFIYQTCTMDCDWMSEELVPTMLFTQYLSQCEGETPFYTPTFCHIGDTLQSAIVCLGPLWRGIRGDGLAYGANIYTRYERRIIFLSLYRCAQPVEAYERTKKIVNDVLKSGNVVESEFEAAKRSLICEMMQCEETLEI
ncbi:unnamed protein product, partial [Cylicostephanus goldi]